jgi:hypothetical protein
VRRLGLDVVVVGTAAVAAFAPLAPQVVERRFSTGIYPAVQQTITSFSNLLPFALLDLLIVVGVFLVVRRIAGAVGDAWHDRSARPIGRLTRDLLVSGAAVYLVFLLLWGLNYRRTPMPARLEASASQPNAETVERLGLEAATELTRLYDEAHKSGWPEAPIRDPSLRRGFLATQRALSDAYPAIPGRLKGSLLGWYFRWAGVDGMINPFGLEVLANPDLLPFEKPFVAAHEWAHLAGYADESEASFVGFLTCMRGDAGAQYSGWLFLYWQIAGEIESDRRAEVHRALGPGPRRDIEAIAERLRRGELPWLRTAGWQVYDQYLKANRVESGVRSYGAVVTLLLRTRFDTGWVPVRRSTSP